MSEENTSGKSNSTQGASGKKAKGGQRAEENRQEGKAAKQEKHQKNEGKDKGEKRPSIGSQAQSSRPQQNNQAAGKPHPQQQQQQAKPQQAAAQPSSARLALFDHLPRKAASNASELIEGDRSLHPATLKIGLMFSRGIIREDDDRVAALLATFCTIIEEYKTPTNKSLSWDLDKHIKAQVQHLVNCRQHCMGMGNLIKFLRFAVSRVSPEISEAEAKTLLLSQLRSFLEERVVFAREAIIQVCADMICDGDVILTFGSSPLLRQVFLSSAENKKFKLIVVDARPLNDGLLSIQVLSPSIQCVYVALSGVTSALEHATKVIVGASALLANGAMLAPAGTAMITAVAKRKNVPVIVACEGYKFCEKVQVDSIVYNELGSPQEIAVIEKGADGANAAVPQTEAGYRGTSSSASRQDEADQALPYQVVNLRYDLTPIGNITAVATETGLIPPTSIPVLMREFRADAAASGSNSL